MYTSCVAGHLTLQPTQLSPIASIATIGNSSNFAFAGNSALPAGWNLPSAHRSIAAAVNPAAIGHSALSAGADESHLVAGMAAWGFDTDAGEGAAGWLSGTAFDSMLLFVVGLMWFKRIFGIADGKTKPGTKAAEEDAARPTVAETPQALSKRISHGIRIGGEAVPGTSIAPPPYRSIGRGGSGIE